MYNPVAQLDAHEGFNCSTVYIHRRNAFLNGFLEGCRITSCLSNIFFVLMNMTKIPKINGQCDHPIPPLYRRTRSRYRLIRRTPSAGFTYRLDRLIPRSSNFRGPPAKMYNIFNSVIGHSHLCCHNYCTFNPSVIFLTQLHSISEYCRILNTPHYLPLY